MPSRSLTARYASSIGDLLVVSAAGALPGSLPGVIGLTADLDCPAIVSGMMTECFMRLLILGRFRAFRWIETCMGRVSL
jgi:hypothetical protein